MRSILFAGLALAVTACSSNVDTNGDGDTREDVATPPAETAAIEPVEVSSALPPTLIDPPEETVTPEGLRIIAHARGNGEQAASGNVVAVHYTGWLQDESAPGGKGKQFDSSRERGDPIRFPLGAGRVIRGWDQGLDGMRVGGRRTLIIPPDLAYGARGRPPVIPQSATLIFDVELMGVE